MFLDIVTVGAFFAISLVIYLTGNTLINARRRARQISDIADRARRTKPTWWTRSLAGAIPQSQNEIDKIERDLKRAGYYSPTALFEYLATRNFLVIAVLFTALGVAAASEPGTSLPKVVLAVGGLTAALGYAIPRIILARQARRRVERIQHGLPDALDIIRMCLTGGLPLRDALERVSREIEFFHPDIAVEFEVIRRQAEADTMAKSLRQFARRIDTPDVNALAALVGQTERLGTHVATAVTEFSDDVRRTYRQRAEERASKTSIKLLFPVVFCLVPPIFILLMGPPLITLRNFIVEGHQPGGILNPQSYGERIGTVPDSVTQPETPESPESLLLP